MFWFIIIIFSALFDSLKAIVSKKSLRNVEPQLAALAGTLFALPVIVLALLVFEKPVFDSVFWSITAMHSIILALALFLYMKSLKMTDVSLSIPFTALSPVFMLFIAPLLIGEYTSPVGTFGVILIAVGTYILNIQKASEGLLEPLRALMRDKGVLIMLFVAFLWSITATIDRIVLRHSTPLFYLAIDYLFMTLIFSVNLLKEKSASYIIDSSKRNFRALAAIGLFFALSGIMYIYAYKMALAAYVISIKRTSILFSVLLGGLIFKEKNIRERLIGAVFIVAGALIILIG